LNFSSVDRHGKIVSYLKEIERTDKVHGTGAE